MSIKPEHISNIASGAKNHEYRRYLLPSSVQRIWFYTTAPVSQLTFVARISGGKTPGQVPEDGGIGNEDFNAGRKVSNYGYEILELWRLKEPVGLQLAVERGCLKGPPQKYVWVPPKVIQDYPIHSLEHVILPRTEAGSFMAQKDVNASVQREITCFFGKDFGEGGKERVTGGDPDLS